MTNDEYKVMDITTRALANLQAVQTRLLNAALKGEVSAEIANQVADHCRDITNAFVRLVKET